MRAAVHAPFVIAAALAALAALATCATLGGCGDPTVTVVAIDPPYGPPIGGSTITIRGRGFDASPGIAPRVAIGGRPAPVVIAAGDDRLIVLTPPALGPGDVDVEVAIGDHTVRVADGFRYSVGPTLTEVTPRDVLVAAGTTRVRLAGTGLLAEDAGPPALRVDGELVDATVVTDRELTFVAPAGWPLREPFIELVNRRGGAILDRAYRYVPGRPGLLLFVRDTARFAVHLDPVDLRTLDVPRFTAFPGLSSVVADGHGGYLALDDIGQIGALDVSEQRVPAPRPASGRLSAIERVGDAYVAFDDDTRRIGRLDPISGELTPLAAAPHPGEGPCALAFDGSRLYASDLEGDPLLPVVRAVDLATGAVGPAVALAIDPAPLIEEMRFFAGTLYAVGDGGLFTVDPASGATAQVPVADVIVGALATYE